MCCQFADSRLQPQSNRRLLNADTHMFILENFRISKKKPFLEEVLPPVAGKCADNANNSRTFSKEKARKKVISQTI